MNKPAGRISEQALLSPQRKELAFILFLLQGKHKTFLMVLGTFSKQTPLNWSPDIPALAYSQGSSYVFVSGWAGAILGLSFLAANEAGVFHGTVVLPGPTLPFLCV